MARVHRFRNPLAFALLAGALLTRAVAAPEDDHRRGVDAFQRGDVVGAMALLRAPAKAGHAPSQSLLAFLLDRADYVDESAALYAQAAAQDDPDALYALGNFHLTGRGVAKDEKRAVALFSKAAEFGHEASIRLMADACARGSMGLTADAAQAERWRARLPRSAR